MTSTNHVSLLFYTLLTERKAHVTIASSRINEEKTKLLRRQTAEFNYLSPRSNFQKKREVNRYNLMK